MDKTNSASEKGEPRGCACPFCDAPVEKIYPFCKDCGKELSRCKKCGRPVPPHQDLCQECEG